MSLVRAPDLWPRKRHPMYSKTRDQFLRDNPTVDTALLAIDLGFTERAVINYQRKIGVRLCKNTPRLGDKARV